MGMLQKMCALDPGHSRGAVSLILIMTMHESLTFISLYLKIVHRKKAHNSKHLNKEPAPPHTVYKQHDG